MGFTTSSKTYYLVESGDCLWNIAYQKYRDGTKWTAIANANGISQSNPVIYPGQKLYVPSASSASSSKIGKYSPTITWFALDSGTERSMFATWDQKYMSFSFKFEYKWEYCLADGKWRTGTSQTDVSEKQSSYTAPDNAKKVRFSVKGTPTTKGLNVNSYNVKWSSKTYDFSNNPPSLPPTPTISIDLYNTLTVAINNIDEDINADNIEIAIYQNDTTKYASVIVPISKDANFANYTCTVPAGYEYKARCRSARSAVNEKNQKTYIYGGWTDFTSNEQSRPNSPSEITTLRPTIISEQMAKTYGVFAEWEEIKTAKTYEVQWTTNSEYFDVSNNVSSQTTEEGKGPRILITNIELGHEYFFRVRSVNDKGASFYWSAIKSVIIGSKPSAPTTWSNVTSAVIGEKLNLYWTHNSTDNSIETYARLYIKITDSLNPTRQPMEYYKVIANNKPEENKDGNSVYEIDTTSSEWSMLEAGFIIKWKVQTAGIASEYSDWSIEREVNVYSKPELTLDIINNDGASIDEVNGFPFYISALATPETQTPISYYIEIVSNQGYETVDESGNSITINPGDKIYQKYYDPEQNSWNFMIEMTPANINLKTDSSYTVNCTVSMNSGLTKTSTQTFTTYFDSLFYEISADVVINKETLEATIKPVCTEFIRVEDPSEWDDEYTEELAQNCSLSVYRREFDGTFTEIATGIDNESNTYVTDPHPSLDYARYRVIAKSNITGTMVYADIEAVKVGEPSIVIQWSEKWSNFESGENGEGIVEPLWSGSMIRIPYNVDISENNTTDVSLIKYAGRKHPVSYYGTQLGSSSTWNVDIPADDKETIYSLRRLAIWTGDVYVRAPSGIGYWANVSVSFNTKHLDVKIPVTFNIKRVEGGI